MKTPNETVKAREDDALRALLAVILTAGLLAGAAVASALYTV